MKLWELIADSNQLKNAKGFTIGKTRKKPVVWKRVHLDDTKDRRTIRVERPDGHGGTVKQYVDPKIEVTLIPKA